MVSVFCICKIQQTRMSPRILGVVVTATVILSGAVTDAVILGGVVTTTVVLASW